MKNLYWAGSFCGFAVRLAIASGVMFFFIQYFRPILGNLLK